MNISANNWKSIKIVENQLKSTNISEISENQRKSIKIVENRLKSTKTMQIREIQWKYVNVDENKLKAIKTYEYPTYPNDWNSKLRNVMTLKKQIPKTEKSKQIKISNIYTSKYPIPEVGGRGGACKSF